MDEFEKAKKAFDKYYEQYKSFSGDIDHKYNHSYQVVKLMEELSKRLGLNKEDTLLAKEIGLLHDIGRFEQLKQYNTYNDRKSINHGEYGAKILFEDRLIENFIEDRQYDRIIYLAVINHNRDNIEEGLNERELLHCKIIRDADKWDIFYVSVTESNEALWGTSNPVFNQEITPEIFDEYMKIGRIDYSKRKGNEDSFITHIAHVFDIYFDYTLENIVEENYMEVIRNRYKYNNKKLKEQLDLAYDKAYKYIDNRLNRK